eukprot:TRINITY_DN4837_c2_g1_i1.p1 TRINITY_DN4837_c2_g1~~TRINITY_DN4837_c2_g1_i1.p1  ORF type:complete len:537 (+),score=140.47 TRINITY_DN4837_c2_g1_i1:56-1666(+)
MRKPASGLGPPPHADFLQWNSAEERWVWQAAFRERTAQTHQRHVHALQTGGRAKVLCVGDSMLERLGTTGARSSELLTSLGVAVAGVGGDGVQHCLWRVERGLVASLPPSVHTIVLYIGTNNVEPSTPAQVSDGIIQVAEALAERQAERVRVDPDAVPAQLVVHGLLPHSDVYKGQEWPQAQRAEGVKALNASVCEINRLIRLRLDRFSEHRLPHLASLRQLGMLHFTTVLHGQLSRGLSAAVEVYEDHVHLNQAGYALFVRQLAAELLRVWPGGNPPAAAAAALRNLQAPLPPPQQQQQHHHQQHHQPGPRARAKRGKAPAAAPPAQLLLRAGTASLAAAPAGSRARAAPGRPALVNLQADAGTGAERADDREEGSLHVGRSAPAATAPLHVDAHASEVEGRPAKRSPPLSASPQPQCRTPPTSPSSQQQPPDVGVIGAGRRAGWDVGSGSTSPARRGECSTDSEWQEEGAMLSPASRPDGDGPPPLKSWASVAAKPREERYSGQLPEMRLRGLRTNQLQPRRSRTGKGEDAEDA